MLLLKGFWDTIRDCDDLYALFAEFYSGCRKIIRISYAFCGFD